MVLSIKKTRGFSLIELLITIGLTSLFLPVLLTALVVSRHNKPQQDVKQEAYGLFTEANEAIRIIRNNWSLFSVNGTFHPQISSNTWILSDGSETINGINRSITISDARRDSSGNIVEVGGTIDPSTKKAVVTVSWTNPYSSNYSSTMYLTRYLNNNSLTHTLPADFLPGTTDHTRIVNTHGGEVILDTLGQGDWCNPQLNVVDVLTLPKQGNTIAAKEGRAYVGTGNGGIGEAYVDVGISNPPQPELPVAIINGTYSGNYNTNGIYSDGTYVYLATTNSSEQVIILDITQPPPYPKIGSVTISGGLPANGIYVDGDILYVTSGIKLYTYNISTKTGPHNAPLTSISMFFNIGNQPTARQIIVKNGYAYVGTGNTLFGLQKFRVSNNGSTLRVVGVSNLTWNQQSQGLSINDTGSRAYVAFNQGSGIFPKGFFIVDTSPSDPPWWWPLPNFLSNVGTYNAGDTDPRGMNIVSGNKAIVVGTGGLLQYQAVNIADETNPVSCGGLVISSGIYGIASVNETDGDSYSYIITGEAKDQFKIIMGGAGGGGYATNGTYTSGIVDPGFNVVYNSFTMNYLRPVDTTFKLQVASADAVSGNCLSSSFYFIGPDGTNNSYFTQGAPIPILDNGLGYKNPGRCFKYKAFFTSTSYTQTPEFDDISVNFSP